MRFLYCIILFFLLSSCQSLGQSRICTSKSKASFETLIQRLQSSIHSSVESTTPDQKVKFAKQGIRWSDQCVLAYPKEAGCYFYRAETTGLYYQAASLRYQKGLKKMIKDIDKVIELDASYEGGGAYRILGNIYLKVPSFSLAKHAITRDVEKARDYAEKAMGVDPQHLENRLLMAEVLFELNAYKEAQPYLSQLVLDFRQKGSYTWHDKKNLKDIERMLFKVQRHLSKRN